MKLFANFTSIPFDYLLISWVTNNVSNLGLHSLERLELKFGLSSEFSKFLDKIPVRMLLDTGTYARLPWQFCNFTCEITN